ncbi:MAG: putative MaoC-like dehydratase [Caulobacteraceae bacterium]|nr:putative MaoC-like dehydratase [Caulobacteraceae bacterium]
MTAAAAARLERVLTQAEFDRFARISGDFNPIHVDAGFAARTRFGRPVAHGLLLISILSGLAQTLRPGWRLRDQAIRFPAPTYAGEPMVFEVVAVAGALHEARYACRVGRADGSATTCDGVIALGAPDTGA